MAESSVKIYNDLIRAKAEMAQKCYPAFDDLLLYALERRHLDIPAITSAFNLDDETSVDLSNYFSKSVRLMQVDEIAYDADEKIHLPGLECALSAMRGHGVSIIFVIKGDCSGVHVYMGVVQYNPAANVVAGMQTFSSVIQANFPGTKFTSLDNNDIYDMSLDIAKCNHIGGLSGIPSLKRDEERSIFVQGIERLIRSMRGKEYTWISIADPIPEALTSSSLEACRNLQSDIHHLVKTQLSKATSKGKTVMLGLFGLLGQGNTTGTSDMSGGALADTTGQSTTKTTGHSYTDTVGTSTTDTTGTSSTQTSGWSETDGTSNSFTQNELESYQRAASAAPSACALAGAAIGSILPGVGTMVGAAVGGLVGTVAKPLITGIGEAVTGKSGHSHTNATSHSNTRSGGQSDTTSSSHADTTSSSHADTYSESEGLTDSKSHTDTSSWANTVSNSVAQQLAAGGFGSFGMSWTKTTTVGQEILNRKAEYAEEVLQAYEKRLQEGLTLGMWNLGHYFCAKDEATYTQGCGILNSLFSGMDSTYEPPRSIKMPEGFNSILRRFQNIYLLFSRKGATKETWVESLHAVEDHPLGVMFNGPATPVNTRELAIVAPFATQDVEGVTVSKRAAFAVNLPLSDKEQSCLALGKILDKGNELQQRVRIKLSNLNKHVAVFGLTGSGKTNTVHHLLCQLWAKHRIPFMVIEPAKAEYRALAARDEFKDDLLVISAGADQSSVCPLRMNPFAFNPGRDHDANRIHVLTHIDRLKATFNSSFPMYASMPYILEEAILQVYRERGWDLGRSVNKYVDIYNEDFSDYLPSLYDLYLKVDSIVRSKGYYQEQQMNIQAALKARLASLMVGAKGSMFNCAKSIPDDDLWNRPVVVELENMGDDDEKAFLMGLLVSKLYEYRKATFAAGVGDNDVPRHVLVIEEAHRLLSNVDENAASMEVANVKGKAVSSFVDMLSEVRAFGQSVIVVDQLPSRVTPNIVKGTGTKIVHRLLAHDDREAVGRTMGLCDSQIEDMGLLLTGECVVNQDGVPKSYMCKVVKNETHERREGGETSPFTAQYKAEHHQLFASDDTSISREDDRAYDAVYKIMMAIACGQAAADLKPVLQRISPKGEELQMFKHYWKNVTNSIWDYYNGNYQLFVAMVRAGAKLLSEPSSEDAYRHAVAEYFRDTSAYAYSVSGIIEGVIFQQICEQNHFLAQVDKHFDTIKDEGNRQNRLAQSLMRALPLLGVPALQLNWEILEKVIMSCLLRITGEKESKQILERLREIHFAS